VAEATGGGGNAPSRPRGQSKAINDAVEALKLLYPDMPGVKGLAETAVQVALEALYPTWTGAVVAAFPWRTNADLIYDCWRLGYVTGFVYDATPGSGGLWSNKLGISTSEWLEGIEQIVLNLKKIDFRHFAFEDGTFDTVFFDPPYKLNGSPDGLPELSKRYGVDVPTKVADRHALMLDGLLECIRISRRYLLVKCQDQVANGEMHWQTVMLKNCAEGYRMKLIDRFDMLGHHIPQPMNPSPRYPNGRKQKHAHGRPSTLLVFERS
jgi:hypothetical protein